MSLPDPMNEMALAESLKLMFNINHFYPQHSEVFLKSIAPILKMLQSTRIPTPPLQQPINYLINALTNVDFLNKKCFQSGASPMFPKADPKCNAEQLINIFDKAITDYKEAELDTAVAPVLTLIRKIYECAPETVKEYIESRLLPSDEDRDVPLGRSETLPSKLLRLSTSPMLPTLRTSISAMMFELSGSDAKKFVNNVGYGFAAGFLMSQNMSIPANAAEAFSDGSRRPSVSGDSSEGAAGINPVTGQRLDAESRHEGPEMTQEEKEREAERLFVLFERCVVEFGDISIMLTPGVHRLRANGVLSAENPVRTAVESGRFEELPDDAPD